MRKLLNTLYVISEDAYLSLNGETVEVRTEEINKTIPLHTLESIVCFSYKGASPALMGKCAMQGIALSFFDRNGKYLASVSHLENGNVLLRREQYRIADDSQKAGKIAQAFLTGKLYNSRSVISRTERDHRMQINDDAVLNAMQRISKYAVNVKQSTDTSILRGIEGNAAEVYFGVFNELILQNKAFFVFKNRSRRPPLDPVNAMLSLAYTLLANDCASALLSVGLDPYVGFLHIDRPGRKSLALDLMEELRGPLADRFVLSLINNRIISNTDFKTMENGAVLLKDDARKTFLSEWQKRKKEEIRHPFLGETVYWGLVPFVQALLLSRFLRSDIDGYPPFFWK